MNELRSFLGRNRQCCVAIWSSLANGPLGEDEYVVQIHDRQRQTAECCDPDLEAAITLAIMDYSGALKPEHEVKP